METRHIRLSHDEAVFTKKEILNLELNFLRSLKRLKTYNFYRKKELAQINRLKITTTALKAKLNTFESTIPEDERIKKRKHNRKHFQTIPEIKPPRPKSKLQKELDEIKEKLARLQ